MLEAQWAKGKFVCVGLDSKFSKIPGSAHTSGSLGCTSIPDVIAAFNRAIVEATHDLVCAYKPNSAFYEEQGVEGAEALRRTIADIHRIAPEVLVIDDAKRADIGDTNLSYVNSVFDYYQADAVTVHPYLGGEALKPFLERTDKGVIVLCRTSNPGAGEFQDMISLSEPLYIHVARRVADVWNKKGNCGLVVGATYPEELGRVREIVGDMPMLIPGVGFQQKDVPIEKQVEQVVTAGQDSRGWGIIMNSSRGVIFASSGADFAEAARRETEKLHRLINQFRAVS